MNKFIILISIFFVSNSFAFSKITLKKDIKLSYSTERSILIFNTYANRGSDYCYIAIKANDNLEEKVIPKGTEFDVSKIEMNNCVLDWEKQCRLDLSGVNVIDSLQIEIMCKDRGLFAQELTPKKVSKILKEFILAK